VAAAVRGAAWRQISYDIDQAIGVSVSHESLRTWYAAAVDYGEPVTPKPRATP
jgi:hypothetical protein